ncbi:hypothetical protein H696_04153 [Fonticula alba]|uniref:Uncharacterized protein n=1 Tax=Fonticula alba TaxID=691883 RepID=A0A058Z882_FONAL|nr:hypothetical protein H696_04153 [Fonticula alba]KCV69747.1 hypothetical protein H696_04153 [Fonticula alba]|eukprot:XP_009496312.1 hypothetical protein H696_04153 [Fonticula alba]
MRMAQTLCLVAGGVELALEVVELRAPAGAVGHGLLSADTQVVLVAKPGGRVRLHGGPVVVGVTPPGAPSHGVALPLGQLYPVDMVHLPATSLDVLLAPADGPVARALCAGWARHPNGSFYAAHDGRTLQIRICTRPVLPGTALRAGERLLLSLNTRGQPLLLGPGDAPRDLAVVCLDSDLADDGLDRPGMLAMLAGAPLRRGDIIRLARPRGRFRVSRLMDRDFREVSAGMATGHGPEPTVIHVRSPRDRPDDRPLVASLRPDPGRPEAVLLDLAPGAPDSAEGTLLVSPAAFRRIAGPDDLRRGAARFLAQGALFDVRPSDRVPRFTMAMHPRDLAALGPVHMDTLHLAPLPGIPVAARVDIRFAGDPAAARGLPCDETLKQAFLAAHAGATMRLDRDLPFEWQGHRLLAGIHGIGWADAPEVDRPVGLLPEKHSAAAGCLHVLAPGAAGPARRQWLLLSPPPGGHAEHQALLSLEARASQLARFPPGRATVNPLAYRELREWLPEAEEAFLRSSGGHALLLEPDPDPRAAPSHQQLTLSAWDFGRLFAGRSLHWAGASMLPPHAARVEIHLSVGPGSGPGAPIKYSSAMEAVLQIMDDTMLSVGQTFDLPLPRGTAHARVAQLLDPHMEPVMAGMLSMRRWPGFVHLSAPGGGLRLLGVPPTVLLQLPLLGPAIRLPVADAISPMHLDHSGIQAPEETLRLLRRHCLDDGPGLFLDQGLHMLPATDPSPELPPHHLLLGQDLHRQLPGPMRLKYAWPPEIAMATCFLSMDEERRLPPLDPEQLERQLYQALGPASVLQTYQKYRITVPGEDSPEQRHEAFLVPTRQMDMHNVARPAGLLVPRLTRITFRTLSRQVDLGPEPHMLAVRCGPERMVFLGAVFAPAPTPLHPGLRLPRDVFQSLCEWRRAAATPPGCLFFLCHSRLFVARSADVLHASRRVVHLAEDFRAHIPTCPEEASPLLLVDPPLVAMVHMRVELAGTEVPLHRLPAALRAAFPDGSVALLERRATPAATFMPELLLDAGHRALPCGLLQPGRTRLRLHLRGPGLASPLSIAYTDDAPPGH